ncbi:MAG: hypothetical protein JXB88_11025 [Spirochaetales bacterium]|nr:hypothetical protein [Spirochaetales bacterium]
MKIILFHMVFLFLLFLGSCKTNPDIITLKKAMQEPCCKLNLETIPEIDYSDITKNSNVTWVDQFGQYSSIRSITSTKDGKYLVSKSASEPVKVWHIGTGKIVSSFGPYHGDFYLTPDSKHILCYNAGHTVELYSLTGTLLKSLDGKKEGFKYVDYCHYGRYFIIEKENNTIEIYDPLTLTCVKTLTTAGSTDKYIDIPGIISPGGEYYSKKINDKEIVLYNSMNGKEITRLSDPDSTFSTITSGPGGLIASAGRNSTLKLWNTEGILLKKWVLNSNERIHCICFSMDGNYLAFSISTFIEIWEIKTGKLTARYDTAENSGTAREQIITAMAFLPGNTYIACGTGESIIFLDILTGKPGCSIKGDSYLGQALDFSGDGNSLAIGYNKSYQISRCEIGLWDMKSGKIQTFRQAEGPHYLWNLDMDKSGKTIVSAGSWDIHLTGELVLWNLEGSYKILKFPEIGSIYYTSFGRNDRYFIIAESRFPVEQGYNLLLFRSDGELVRVIHRDTSLPFIDLCPADFSADGRYIAGITGNGIIIWNFNGSIYKKLQKGQFPRFHPDSDILAFTPDNKKVLLYAIHNNEIQYEIVFGKGDPGITGISFSYDGKYLVAVHGEKENSFKVSIAEVSSGKIVKTYTGDAERGIETARLSTDNKFLALIENSWTVKIVNLQTGKYLVISNFETGHWTVYDDEFNFDYSQGGENYIGLADGLKPLTGKEYERFYKPGLFVRFFSGGEKS